MRKTKFITNIFLATRKFHTGKAGQNLILTKFAISELKKRVNFLLSLVCEFPSEVSIRICDSEEMISMNEYYRGKNKETDVLSFPSGDMVEPSSGLYYLGDILICLPVCHRQAKAARVPLVKEIEKMIIHGLVHLKGLDHDRNESAFRVMLALEKSLQKELHGEMGHPDWLDASLKASQIG